VLTQGGKGSDGVSGQPFRVAELKGRLQVEPELGIHIEEMPQPQGRVAGDGSPAIQDLADAVGRYADLSRGR